MPFGNYGADGTVYYLDDVPEPAAVRLLGLGLLIVTRRHRRAP